MKGVEPMSNLLFLSAEIVSDRMILMKKEAPREPLQTFPLGHFAVEFLNRIGENIVVFDYIRRDAAELILKSQVDKIISRLREQKNINIRIEDFAYNSLQEAAIFDLSNGGRGIGNQVESLLINPLSRWLFDNEISGDANIVIEGFNTTANPPSVICRREETGK